MKTKLLFVCSMGIDRSPCAASLFEKSSHYEAKFAGISELADKPICREDIECADRIFAMEYEHKRFILENFKKEIKSKPEIIVLDVSNDFCRHDEELERLLRIRLEKEGYL